MNGQGKQIGRVLVLLGLLLLAWGCGRAREASSQGPTLPYAPSPTVSLRQQPTATPFPPEPPTPVWTPTPQVWTWALAPDVPQAVAQTVVSPHERWQRTAETAAADALIAWATQPEQPVSAHWRYALVAPFFTIARGPDLRALQAFWQGQSQEGVDAPYLLVSAETRAALTAFWGPPAAERVHTAPADTLLQQAWATGAWALVPFEALEPRWLVLPIAGHYPWDEGYPLALPLTVQGGPGVAAAEDLPRPQDNFSPDRLTVVALTGVTALVRATAYTMENKGLTYPAEAIGPLLAAADITHISNEIPFDPNCPPPNPSQKGLKFCSDPRYIALLEAVGTDVVELTGDHFNDRGPEAVYYTVQMYQERGWAYYGGGENLAAARRPALFEHHGNRIAFVGCNAKGGGYAKAAANYPGAAACDWDFLTQQIAELRAQGYLPIATFQHHEYYVFDPPATMKADFQRLADAGAVIVSGSQAHHPHGLAFYHGALLTYGLGNLFFDQKGMVPYGDQAFIALHYFYDNRHLSTRLIPIRFVDFAKPVPMSLEEAKPLLEQVFAVSQGP